MHRDSGVAEHRLDPGGGDHDVRFGIVERSVPERDKLALHVNFDFNKATIRKGEDAELQKAVAFIKKYPGSEVSLVGYTDSIGGDAYNLKLSEKRAQAVKDYLASHGIDGSKISASGRGKADPIGDNKTEKGRAENRRVDILVGQ